MKTIYAVSEGSYSDYHVRALFTEKDLAEAHAAQLNAQKTYGEACVEEMPLLDSLPEMRTIYFANAKSLDDEPMIHHALTEPEYDEDARVAIRGKLHHYYNKTRGWHITSQALDPQRCFQLIREFQAQQKAKEAGIS